MRKMGISGLVLVCLLATVPVMAAEGGQVGSWWDGVVGWVTEMVKLVTAEENGSLEPNGLSESQQNPTLNGVDESESETGGTMEPNG
jgi:hypothetical protein